MAKTVLCDTCGVRAVEVGAEHDGTEYVACAVCLGDNEPSEPIAASEIADDDAIHAAIEDGADIGGLL